MKKLAALLALALFACGGEAYDEPSAGPEDLGDDSSPPSEIGSLEQAFTDLRFGFRSHPEATAAEVAKAQSAVQCAVGRWAAAAGIVGLTYSPTDGAGADHYVEPRNSATMGGRAGWTVGGNWSTATIRVLKTMSAGDLCDVVVHEMGAHVLRRLNDEGHLTSPDNNAFDSPTNYNNPVYIYATNVSLVCLSAPCNGLGVPEHF